MSLSALHKRGNTGGGSIHISALFEKYKTRLCPPQGIVIRAFCAVIEAELGTTLSTSSVRYAPHSRTLYITASGPHKTEILLRETRILAECRNTLGERGAPQYIV